jgi:hypothetical protein
VKGLDGSDPGGAGAKDLGDFTCRHAVVGEGDDAVVEFGGERFHRWDLLELPTTIIDPDNRRKNEI